MRVQPPDVEAWLVPYLRSALVGEGVEVDNKEPAELRAPLSRPLVVVRDDSGARASLGTFQHQVGISVLAGSRLNDGLARRLARVVYAVATDEAIALEPGSPIVSVVFEDCRGPYAVVEDHDVSRQYMTVGYVTAGTW